MNLKKGEIVKKFMKVDDEMLFEIKNNTSKVFDIIEGYCLSRGLYARK